MKYTITINQKQAVELGLTNINQIIILDLLSTASTWAKTEIIEDEVYYWVARQVISSELTVLNLQPDTVYRHVKALAENGFIDYVKKGRKDFIKMTKKGSSYYVGNESELTASKLGNESETNSEMNPTYQNTKLHQGTKKDLSEKDVVDFSILGLSEKDIEEVKKIRKQNKGGGLSQRAVKGLAKEFQKARDLGFTDDEILTKWDVRGWKSFEADWMGQPPKTRKVLKKRDLSFLDDNKPKGDAIEGDFKHE